MLFWLTRLSTLVWRGPGRFLLVLVAAFVLSWLAMAMFEPAGSEIAQPKHYWWWFVVTAFTVGYGDISPVSLGGRIAGFLVMATTIATAAALLNHLLERASSRRTRRIRGLVHVKRQDHYIIVGHVPARTERLIDEFTAADVDVVLCATGDIDEHPFPDRRSVDFVRGGISDDSLYEKASFGTARAVVIDTTGQNEDEQAMLYALIVNQRFPSLHIVVAVRDLERASALMRPFGQVFECVDQYDYRLIADAAQDPGVSRFHNDIRTSATAVNTQSLRIPDGVADLTVRDVMVPLKERLNASVCALDDGDDFMSNPPMSAVLRPGGTLYYIADRRFTWQDVKSALELVQ